MRVNFSEQGAGVSEAGSGGMRGGAISENGFDFYVGGHQGAGGLARTPVSPLGLRQNAWQLLCGA